MKPAKKSYVRAMSRKLNFDFIIKNSNLIFPAFLACFLEKFAFRVNFVRNKFLDKTEIYYEYNIF